MTESDTKPDSDESTIPELREAAKRGRDAIAKAEAQEREIAFLKAGINPDDPEQPGLKYFVKGYEGELTAEAIKAEAEAAGFAGKPKTPPPEGGDGEEGHENRGDQGDGLTEEERRVQEISNDVRSGANIPGNPPEEDPMTVGYNNYLDRRRNGDRREDAASEVIGRIIGGAVEGDERFIVQE